MRLVLFLLLAFSASSTAQTQPLAADLPILKKALWELHPGLLRYNTARDMERHFTTLEKDVAKAQSLREQYLALSQFLAKIRCGHTWASFFNQSDAIAQQLFQDQDRLPFYFRWIDGRMVITRNFSSLAALKPGTEVTAVNAIPVKEIFSRLMTIGRADGGNDFKRINSLQVQGLSELEAFDVFFPLLFPQKSPEMVLDIKPFGGKPTRLKAMALSAADRKSAIIPPSADGPLWSFKILKNNTGYLKMPTWVTYKTKWDWEKYLDGVFQTLKSQGAKTLIIDLHGNEGGTELGNSLVARFVSQEIAVSGEQRFVRYRKAPVDLLPYLDTWDPSFKDWGEDAVAAGAGLFTLKKYEGAGKGIVVKPSPNRFSGKVYVLVDGTNSSATFQFAQTMQSHGLGLLVGEPTGGNQRGINGSSFFFLRLPNSQLEVDLPLVGIFPRDKKPDAGLTPDIVATTKVEDIANGLDPALEILLKLGRGDHP